MPICSQLWRRFTCTLITFFIVMVTERGAHAQQGVCAYCCVDNECVGGVHEDDCHAWGGSCSESCCNCDGTETCCAAGVCYYNKTPTCCELILLGDIVQYCQEPCTPEGACCQEGGNCEEVKRSECDGKFRGEDTVCDAVICAGHGACCYTDTNGTPQCAIAEHGECTDNYNGIFQGENSNCDGCFPLEEACCYEDPQITQGLTAVWCTNEYPNDCTNNGGAAQGTGSTCNQGINTDYCCTGAYKGGITLPDCCADAGGVIPNDAPSQAAFCCEADGSTQQTDIAGCCDEFGLTGVIDWDAFYGELGICCLPDGTCTDNASDMCCDVAGGTFHLDKNCSQHGSLCDERTSACCLPDGSCQVTAYSACLAAAGQPQADTMCTSGLCGCSVDLAIDSNNNGIVAAGDAFIEEIAPGKIIALNSDDDDQDLTLDHQQPYPPYGDDELEALEISIDPAEVQGDCQLTFPSSVRIYESNATSGLLVPIYSGAILPIPSSGDLGLSVEGIAVSQTQGDVLITLMCDCDGDSIMDREDNVVATIIEADILVDSNNDTYNDHADNRFEHVHDVNAAVGALIEVNFDDDNDNDIIDHEDAYFASEDEIFPVDLLLNAPAGTLSNATFTLDVINPHPDPDIIKLWKNPDKTDPLVLPHTMSESDFPATYFIEGTGWQQDRVSLQLTAAKSQHTLAEDAAYLYPGERSVLLQGDVAAGDNPRVTVTGLPDGTSFELKIFRDGLHINTLNYTINTIAASYEIDAAGSRTTPPQGAVYSAEVIADDGRLSMTSLPDGTLVHDVPFAISTQLLGDPMVADGSSMYELEITVLDEFDNEVEDWAVSVILHAAAGDEDPIGAITDNTGKASVCLPAPATAWETYDVSVYSYPAALEHVELTVVEPSGSLSALQTTLDIAQEQTTFVTLDLPDTDDGTTVYWTVSNYDPLLASTASYVESTVSNGQSTIEVSSKNANIGACHVSATVASKLFQTALTFTSSAALTMEFDGPPIVIGEETVTHTEQLTTEVARPPSLNGGVWGTPEVVRTSPHLTVPADRTVTIHGDPNEDYAVYQAGNTPSPYITLLGLSPEGTITTDTNGEASFTIQSTGVFVWSGGNHDYLAEVAITVELDNPTIASVSETRSVFVVAKNVWTSTIDSVASFFGADPQTKAGIAASVAGGVLIVGDIGSMVKNMWRWAGFSETDPNYLELALAGLGLATEFAIGIGEVPDTGISMVKSLVAFLPSGKFTTVMVLMMQRMIRNATSFSDFVANLTYMIDRHSYMLAAEQAFTSFTTFGAGLNNLKHFGEAMVHAVEDTIALYGLQGEKLRNYVSALYLLKAPARTAIQVASNTREALGAMAGAMHHGVEGHQLSRVLNYDEFFAPSLYKGTPSDYTRMDFLDDLRLVTESTPGAQVDGLAEYFRQLSTVNTTLNGGALGYRYELESLAQELRILTQQGFQPNAIGIRRTIGQQGSPIGDLDWWINTSNGPMIFAECKVNPRKHFKKRAQGEKGVSELVSDLIYAVEQGADTFRFIVGEYYIPPTATQNGYLVPLRIERAARLFQNQLDIEFVYIPWR